MEVKNKHMTYNQRIWPFMSADATLHSCRVHCACPTRNWPTGISNTGTYVILFVDSYLMFHEMTTIYWNMAGTIQSQVKQVHTAVFEWYHCAI